MCISVRLNFAYIQGCTYMSFATNTEARTKIARVPLESNTPLSPSFLGTRYIVTAVTYGTSLVVNDAHGILWNTMFVMYLMVVNRRLVAGEGRCL